MAARSIIVGSLDSSPKRITGRNGRRVRKQNLSVIQKSKTKSPDFSIEGEGRICTVYLLRPLTPAAFDWVQEHIPEDAQRLGNAIAVEYRYIGAIAEGILADGLVVV